MEENHSITKRIIGCCFEVHKEIGPGFNEKIYHNALKLLLEQKGLRYEQKRNLKSFILTKRSVALGQI